jgi:protein disulfide-isomerase
MRTAGWIAGLVVLTAASTASAKGWMRDVERALSVAQSEQRPLVLFVSSDHCVHCDRMIATTFRDVNVRQTLGSSFVVAAIKGAERPDLIEHLQIRSFPTTVLVSPEGEVLDLVIGYVDAERFQQRLGRLARGARRMERAPAAPQQVAERLASSSQRRLR